MGYTKSQVTSSIKDSFYTIYQYGATNPDQVFLLLGKTILATAKEFQTRYQRGTVSAKKEEFTLLAKKLEQTVSHLRAGKTTQQLEDAVLSSDEITSMMPDEDNRSAFYNHIVKKMRGTSHPERRANYPQKVSLTDPLILQRVGLSAYNELKSSDPRRQPSLHDLDKSLIKEGDKIAKAIRDIK